MAEFVEFRTEEWVDELNTLERIKLFSPSEIKNITKKRKDFEYKIQRRTKDKDNFLQYIQFETDLHKIIKARGEELKIKKADLEYSHSARIANLWKQVIFLFQDDVNLWRSYFTFCRNVRFTVSGSQMLTKMLQVHADKPDLWVFAAEWEFEQCFSVENARQYLIRGIRNHPENKMLHKEFFRLELEYAKIKNDEVQDQLKKTPKLIIDETTNDIIHCKLAEALYESSTKKIQDVDYKIDLLKIAKKFPNTGGIQNKIVQDLKKNHYDEELTWDTVARRELGDLEATITSLGGEEPMEIDGEKKRKNKDLKEAILRSVDVFENTVNKLNTTKMWSLYLDYVLELNTNQSSVEGYKKKLLRNAFEGAAKAKHLEEKYFLQWFDILIAEGKPKTARRVLEMGTEQHPESFKLWYTRLRFHLTRDHEEIGAEVFKEAVARFPDELSLWKLMIQYQQTKSSPKVEETFKAGLARGGAISQALKPFYAEWLVMTMGMGEARAIILEKLKDPPCLELYVKMASLECMQAERNMQQIRKWHDQAVEHFGKNNIDVWMNYVRFEMTVGEPINIDKVHKRAMATLEPKLAEYFLAEFNFYTKT